MLKNWKYRLNFPNPATTGPQTLPDHEKFRTIGGPQNTLYIHVLTLHYAVQV